MLSRGLAVTSCSSGCAQNGGSLAWTYSKLADGAAAVQSVTFSAKQKGPASVAGGVSSPASSPGLAFATVVVSGLRERAG